MAKKKHVRASKSLFPKKINNLDRPQSDICNQTDICSCIVCNTKDEIKCLEAFQETFQRDYNFIEILKKQQKRNYNIDLWKAIFPYFFALVLLFSQFDKSILVAGILYVTKKYLLKTIPLPF